jgi:putative ABC transport system permease protein
MAGSPRIAPDRRTGDRRGKRLLGEAIEYLQRTDPQNSQQAIELMTERFRRMAYGAELREIAMVAIDSFRQNRVRFALTALGMVIGTASLILVVTIGLTGKHYVLTQIQNIGANMIEVEYRGGGTRATPTQADNLTMEDMHAVQVQVPGVRAASPVVPLIERLPLGGGKEGDVTVLGVEPAYLYVRNLEVLAGRFFDADDGRNKVALLTQKLAKKVFGGQDAAVGRTMKISGLPFTIIGTFRERVDTFGQSEVVEDTILIPYTISRYFTGSNTVHQIYFSMADPSDVPQATLQIKQVIESRHRPESTYEFYNLTQLLTVASRTANALTAVLLLISTVTLIVSGVGIMNIMLVTVKSRTREIGIRKAVGATRREIRTQFLAEAIFISLTGGILGTLIGMAIPISVRLFTEYHIPISGLSVIIAIVVSSLVGIIFGTLPASRAAQLDPVESLRYE